MGAAPVHDLALALTVVHAVAVAVDVGVAVAVAVAVPYSFFRSIILYYIVLYCIVLEGEI